VSGELFSGEALNKNRINMDLNHLNKYQDWKSSLDSSADLNIWDYIDYNIHPEDVLILSELFFPKFIEIDDCIFFEFRFDENTYQTWRLNFGNDRRAIEAMINHVHIYDIFSHCEPDIEDSVFDRLAQVLQNAWSMYFQKVFPDKKIEIEYVSGEQDYGPTLYIYQK